MGVAHLHFQRYRQIRDKSRHVCSRAESILRENAHLRNYAITCHFHEGTLVLHGCVPCYYFKQIAQTVVGEVDGVEHVVNQIKVNDAFDSAKVRS